MVVQEQLEQFDQIRDRTALIEQQYKEQKRILEKLRAQEQVFSIMCAGCWGHESGAGARGLLRESWLVCCVKSPHRNEYDFNVRRQVMSLVLTRNFQVLKEELDGCTHNVTEEVERKESQIQKNQGLKKDIKGAQEGLRANRQALEKSERDLADLTRKKQVEDKKLQGTEESKVHIFCRPPRPWHCGSSRKL